MSFVTGFPFERTTRSSKTAVRRMNSARSTVPGRAATCTPFTSGVRVVVKDLGLGTVLKVVGRGYLVRLDAGVQHIARPEELERMPRLK